MDRVASTDRLVRLLRQKLAERSKARGANKSEQATPVRSAGHAGVRAIANDLARAGSDDAYLRRVLVEQLLIDQFDPALSNDANFQQVVDEVVKIMNADGEVGALLSRSVVELRAKNA